ncbi:PTPRC [Bugula neritina]|uniref:PTPRC n=1 Tax=Bugula neritina TaxID=10212 RepID=A0A7J7IT97_BUGNE|nr:PTPRC [Bugula neritina]
MIFSRSYKDTPAAKKKAAIRKNKKLKALEEKRIGQVSMNSVSCETFLSSYKKKLKDQFLPIEFKALGRSSEEYPQLIASLPCNFQKNNSRNVLPYDHSRVCLDTPPTMVDNDYINANFIFKMQNAKRVKAYIAARDLYQTQ